MLESVSHQILKFNLKTNAKGKTNKASLYDIFNV